MDDIAALKSQIAQLSNQIQTMHNQLSIVLRSLGSSALYNPTSIIPFGQTSIQVLQQNAGSPVTPITATGLAGLVGYINFQYAGFTGFIPYAQ